MMVYSNIMKSSSHCDGGCPLALLPSCLSPCPLALVSAPTSTARAAQTGGRAAAPWLKGQGGLSGPAALGRPGQCRSRGRHLSRCLCRPQLRPPRPRCVSGAPGFTNHLPFQTGPTRTRRDRVKGRARRRRRAHRRPQSRPEQRRERQERSKQRPWSVSRRRQSRGGAQRRRRPRALACWLSFRRRQRRHRLRRRPLRSRKGRERPCGGNGGRCK